MSCPIKVNSNTIELTVRTSCYCILDLFCVTALMCHTQQTNYGNMEQKMREIGATYMVLWARTKGRHH